MFEPLPSEVSFPSLERELCGFWQREEIFRRSVEQCRGRPIFTFYEGPPTANGKPHWGHVLTRAAKDVFLRYKTMTGFFVPRRAGWDTHGLPVETEVEKELGIHGKADIEKYGIEAFSKKCLESVFRYVGDWEEMSDRVGFWVDTEDAYATFHRPFVESVWWALSQLFERGLLYQGHKIVWWWPQGGTALSASEVGDGYRTVDDPSIVVRFPVKGEERTSFLAWTTTPWTLPSNVALAVAADETYVEVALSDGEHLILAADLREKVLGERDHSIVREMKGTELVGMKYEPPFRYREPEGGKAHEVATADFVTLDTGTGIVHSAPAFGEDDFRMACEGGFGFLQLVEPDGRFSDDVTDFAGRHCKEADKDIIRNLNERGVLFSRETYRHEYPFCPRADQDPLIQYARRSWFIRTSTEKEHVVANNAEVTWQPAHIKDGRMGDFLRNNVDWAISRERWWGTPLPIWVNDETGSMECISSVEDILQRNPDAFRSFEEARERDPELREDLMVHKPWIDAVTWTKDGEPGTYRRVPEVVDCWFDAGSMPFAQWGYPHRNREKFQEAFPADFITEAIDQTRGWWNALLQISTLLFPEAGVPHPFRSCVVLGHVVDRKGLKLSKRLKNYEPWQELFDRHGADAVRWALFTAGVPGLNIRFDADSAKDSTRELLLKVWNVLSFFVTYARIDGWEPGRGEVKRSALDTWILAELDATVRDVRGAFDALEVHCASRRIQAFVDALSNWYVRRSRPRFWAEGESADKNAAFATLHEALCQLSRLLAPFTPFLAESLYQRMVRPADESAPPSVHLDCFPEPWDERCREDLRRSMNLVRDVVALGLKVRANHSLKVRQPLGKALLVLSDQESFDDVEEARRVIGEELNVHSVELTDEVEKYVEIEVVPNFKVLGRKLGKKMKPCQAALKSSEGSSLLGRLEQAGCFELELDDGGTITLSKEDVEIRFTAKEGFAAAGERGRVVVLDTRVTPELRKEGLAREAINRIQNARKTMDLPYEARIAVTWEAEGDLAEALAEQAEHVAAETLATAFQQGAPEGERHETEVDGLPFAFGISRTTS